MPLLELQIKATLENVKDLRPSGDDYTIFGKIKCTSCHEDHNKEVGITSNEENELTRSKGTANFVWTCGFCKREASANFEKTSSKNPLFREYTVGDDSAPKFQTLCRLDCRGLEVTSFDPKGTWTCTSTESSTKFDSVEFENGEWTDYDEQGGVPVSIMEFEARWQRA